MDSVTNCKDEIGASLFFWFLDIKVGDMGVTLSRLNPMGKIIARTMTCGGTFLILIKNNWIREILTTDTRAEIHKRKGTK